MPSTVLIDTGVIVALLNRRDAFHETVANLFIERDAGRAVPLMSTWPVVAEACSFLPDHEQVRVLEWLPAAGVDIVSIDAGLDFMRGIMTRYADLPCDFADASLLYAAHVTKIREVWTLDRDFQVFRLPDRSRFTVVPGGGSPKRR